MQEKDVKLQIGAQVGQFEQEFDIKNGRSMGQKVQFAFTFISESWNFCKVFYPPQIQFVALKLGMQICFEISTTPKGVVVMFSPEGGQTVF